MKFTVKTVKGVVYPFELEPSTTVSTTEIKFHHNTLDPISKGEDCRTH